MRFIVFGITDSKQPFIQPEAMAAIRQGKIFSGGKRHHELVEHLLPEHSQWIDITVPLEEVFKQYRAFDDSAEIIVFASGDPLFYGFANTIQRKMPQAEIIVYPAFNSLQMLAHRLVMPYHDMRIVSLTGRPWQEFDRALIERAPRIGVLTDCEHTPAAIARRMIEYGYTDYETAIGEHLGNPEKECVTRLSLEETAKHEFTMPNCVILSSTGSAMHRRFGLPDSSFALLDSREKMITKMPIRLLSLQALDLPRRQVFWDIGFCTGSVSIEARLLFPHLQIEAFEIRPECEAIVSENMRRHGAPGIGIHMGDFLSDDGSLQPPDAVFIGGHGGRLKEIMAKVKTCLSPGGVIVMNSVTSPVVDHVTDRPSSRQLFEEACRTLGFIPHPATHITLNDHNPIDILKCEQPL